VRLEKTGPGPISGECGMGGKKRGDGDKRPRFMQRDWRGGEAMSIQLLGAFQGLKRVVASAGGATWRDGAKPS